MPGFEQPPMRRFGDHSAVRNSVFDNALTTVQSLPPIENSRYKLQLSDVHYSGPATYTLAAHKQALLGGRSLTRRMHGTFSLVDKSSGDIVDRRKMALASVPTLTNQGTFVLDGTASAVSHQLRLLPGIYTRTKGSGGTEAHVNLLPGTGVPHRIALDAETGVFRTSVGQAEIPTISLLKAFGATDEELKNSWGEELFKVNQKADRPHHIDKYWERMGPAGAIPDGTDKRQVLAEKLSKYPLDPWVMERTLGKKYTNYGKDPLLDTTKKLLSVARGETTPDDRDNPAFSSVWGPEHLIAERLHRSAPILNKMLWAATNVGNLKRLTPGMFNPAIRALFTKSGLAIGPEGNAATEYVDHGARITKVGEGGIGRNAESVPMSAREISTGQFPFIDLSRTSESETIGVDLRVAFGTRLGTDKRIYAPLQDRKSGKIIFKSPQDVMEATLAFPGAMNSKAPVIPVIQRGKLTFAPRHEVDYVVPTMEQSFSPLTNMVPLKSNSKAHRSSMGSRMITQSLPLVQPEAPFVRTQVPNQPGKSFEELYGRHMGPVYAGNKPGVVKEVKRGEITVQYQDGTETKHELHDYMPTGRKSGLHNIPLVQPGDPVAPGQLLARSNYTDEKGHAAYGANLRVAYMSGRGNVYEDSILVSQSAAQRLTSDHLYKHTLQPDEHTILGKRPHVAAFSGKYDLNQLKKMDDDGVVLPGQKLNYGDPMILGIRKKPGIFGRLSRGAKSGLSDVSETWEHHDPGEVTDVVKGPNGPVVMVRTQMAFQSGDKLSGRHGNKGIGVVVPDHHMPLDEQGRPIDVILSSLGTISRANPSAIFESILGKIAAKRGQPYTVNDFDDNGDQRNISKWVREEMDKHGVKFRETLTDQKTGKPIPGVGVGNLYVMKLHHIASAKAKGRGLGGHDESGQPLRGQTGKAMRASLGDTNALLSHGATEVIHDAHMNKGLANEEFWAAYMQGFPAPKPSQSPAFARFITELRASGVDPIHKDGRYHLKALTNERVQELAGDREIKNGETLDFSRNGAPYPGGLFDDRIFGNTDSMGTWGKITLHEKMLNPAFEEPARRLLGLTEKQFRDTIAGRHEIATGTGMEAIGAALGTLNVAQELKKTRAQALSSRKTTRDEANRKLGFLKGLEKNGQNPKDWMLSAVPVLPPGLRPVRPGAHGAQDMVVSDANLLYKELMEANQAYKDLSQHTHDVGDERLNVYDAVRATVGLGDPIGAKNKERGVKGILQRLLGDTAKFSYIQQKLLGTPTNLSGRGQALPNPDLDMDQIGIPESVAWEIYHPFVVRRLVRQGIPRAEVAELVEKREKISKDALLAEMKDRPVTATRYPALHRYSVMGFNPVLVPGDALHINHLVTKPYAADFDGDTFTIQVPLSDKSVQEVKDKLLPSKNLFSPATMKASNFLPNMEYVQGLHALSTQEDKTNPPVKFASAKDALKAFASGRINFDTRVEITG